MRHPAGHVAEAGTDAQRRQAAAVAIEHLLAQVDDDRARSAHVRHHQQGAARMLRQAHARLARHAEGQAGQGALEGGQRVHAAARGGQDGAAERARVECDHGRATGDEQQCAEGAPPGRRAGALPVRGRYRARPARRRVPASSPHIARAPPGPAIGGQACDGGGDHSLHVFSSRRRKGRARLRLAGGAERRRTGLWRSLCSR
ncbi:hypothetical protein [Massilia sp. Se16.2.3]|uniref:hypothetical protein n=1 Tax=Massilia sp. Se16.2.3 TaxID=2709303 RepID=UPI001E51CDDA|nr:hypothetical protein [Massilia sp. Se16.2.3]